MNDLVGQQVPHDVAQAEEEAHGGLRVSMHLRTGVDELLVPRAAGDQVHPNGPWTSCKTEPRNVEAARRQRRKGVGGQGMGSRLKFRPCLDVIEGEGRDANATAVLDLIAKGRKCVRMSLNTMAASSCGYRSIGCAVMVVHNSRFLQRSQNRPSQPKHGTQEGDVRLAA